MASAAALLERFDEIDKRGRRLDLAARNGAADARQILHHHAASPDVEMAYFGIAHLPIRQPDIMARGVQESARTLLPQPVEGRCPGLAHRVVGTLFAPAEAVQDDQHHGPPLLHFPILVLPGIGYCGLRRERQSAVAAYAATLPASQPSIA